MTERLASTDQQPPDRNNVGAAQEVRVTSNRTLAWRAVAMLGVAAAFAVGSWYGAHMEAARQPWGRERLLSTALDSVRVNFLDSLPESELMRRAVSGMLRELHDPYAALLEREGMNIYRGTLRGESQGLGMLLRMRGAAAMVRRVQPGSPAAKAGLRAGDQVVEVDGRSAGDAWNLPRADVATRDSARPVSDTMMLRIVRAAGGDSVNVALVRAPWHVSAVSEALMATGSVGYARLASSATGSAEELERAVDSLMDRGARSLILDLRGNPGGLYDEGVRVASLFLSRGDVVASLDRRGTTQPQVEIVRRTRWPTLPLVVLVDANTASSAELIAAALRDHGRALLVGDHTYGKGVVQRVVPINAEISLRLTTARWLPPSGVALERREEKAGRVTGGLTPDILLSSAGRLDPSSVPASLSPTMARALSDAVDAAIHRATLDGWSGAPLPLLERQLRAHLAQAIAVIEAEPARQIALVGDGTRVAVRRLLEMSRGDEALWSYTANDDPSLRAALDVLAPNRLLVLSRSDSVDVSTSLSAMSGDSALVARLQTWTNRRFAASRADLDSVTLQAATRAGVSPRIEGRLRTGARDTVIAVQFGASPITPAFASGARVQLADPSGATTPLEAEIVARIAFRAPLTPGSDSLKTDGWRYGWSYLVALPTATAAAHTAAFGGWMIVPVPSTSEDATTTPPRRRATTRSTARGLEQ